MNPFKRVKQEPTPARSASVNIKYEADGVGYASVCDTTIYVRFSGEDMRDVSQRNLQSLLDVLPEMVREYCEAQRAAEKVVKRK